VYPEQITQSVSQLKIVCAIPDRKISNAVSDQYLLSNRIAEDEFCFPGKLFFIPPGFKFFRIPPLAKVRVSVNIKTIQKAIIEPVFTISMRFRSHPNNAKITINSIPATLPTYTIHPILSSLSIVSIMQGLLSRRSILISPKFLLSNFKFQAVNGYVVSRLTVVSILVQDSVLKSIADQFQLSPWRSSCFFDSGVNRH
jgi:hypothetical protein